MIVTPTSNELLLCFGGNGRSNGFPKMVLDTEKRQTFIKDLMKLVKKYGFDGVDYNWEYPGYNMRVGSYFGG